MTCNASNSHNEISISESYAQSIGRITRSRRDEASSFHVSEDILKRRKQSWDNLFEKYANMSNEVLLNIRTLELNEEDADQYSSKCVCMRKSRAQVQYWVDTGMPMFDTSVEQSDHTVTGSSLSEGEIRSPFPENLTVSHKSNGKQKSMAISSSYSSVDTAAYILSNTNLNKQTRTTGIESAKASHKKGYKIVSCDRSLNGWITKDKSSEVLAQTAEFKSNDNNNEFPIKVGNIELESGSHCTSTSDEENVIVSKSKDFEEQSSLNCLQRASRISECLNIGEQNDASRKKSSTDLTMKKRKKNSSTSEDIVSRHGKPKMLRKKLFTVRTSPVDIITPIHVGTQRLFKASQNWHPALESPQLIKRKSWSFRKQVNLRRRRKKTSLPATIVENVRKENATLLRENGEEENQMEENKSDTSASDVTNHLNLTPTSHRAKLTSVESSIKKHMNDSTIQTVTSISNEDQMIVQNSQESWETDNIAESKEETIFLKDRMGTSSQPVSLNTKDISDSINAEVKSTRERVCENSRVNLNPVILVQRLSERDLEYYKVQNKLVNADKIDSTSELSENSVLKVEESNLCRKKNLYVRSLSSLSNSYQSEKSSLSMKVKTIDNRNYIESINSTISDQSTIIMYPCENITNHLLPIKQNFDNLTSVCSNSLQNLQFTNEQYRPILENEKLKIQNKLNPIVVLERLKTIDEHERHNETEQDTVDRDKNSEQSIQKVFGVPDKLSSVNSALSQCTKDRTIVKNDINKKPLVELTKLPLINNSCYTSATENRIQQTNSYERNKDNLKSIKMSSELHLPKSSQEEKSVTSDAKFVIGSSDTCNSVRESTPSPSKQFFDYNIFKSPSSNVDSNESIKDKQSVKRTNEIMEDPEEYFSKNSQCQFANDSDCITIGSRCNNLMNSLTSLSYNNKSQLVGQETNNICSLLSVELPSDEENSFIKLIKNFRSRKRQKMTLNKTPTDEESIKVHNNGEDGANFTNRSEESVKKTVDRHSSKFVNETRSNIWNSNSNGHAPKMKRMKDKLTKSEGQKSPIKKANELQTLYKDLTENDKDPNETIHIRKVNVSFGTASSSCESDIGTPTFSKRKRISRILNDDTTDDDERAVVELNKSLLHDNGVTLQTISSNAEINTGLHTLVTRKQSVNKKNIFMSSDEGTDDSEKLNTSLRNKNLYSLRIKDNVSRSPVSNRKTQKFIFASSDEESADEFSRIFTKSSKSEKLTVARKLPSSVTAQNEKYIRESCEDRWKTTKHDTLTFLLDDSDDKWENDKHVFGSNQNKLKSDKRNNYGAKVDNDEESTAKKIIIFRTRKYGVSDLDET